jgi:Sulfotransferase domain
VREFLARFRWARRLRHAWFRYQLRRPARVPDGWVVAAPDFVGVGTQKAGTTWWYHLLTRHPCVHHANRPKELHFFDPYWRRPFGDDDVQAYARRFARPAGQQAGEWSPAYMTFFWAPPLLRQAAPRARLLVMLRDPVERYASALNMALTSRRKIPPMMAKEAYRRGFYAEQLERLFQHYARDEVLVLQYEHCRAEPALQLARTYRFLGLDDSFLPGDLTRAMNPTVSTKLSLDADTTRFLIDAYTPDVTALDELVDLDLGLWPHFRHLSP